MITTRMLRPRVGDKFLGRHYPPFNPRRIRTVVTKANRKRVSYVVFDKSGNGQQYDIAREDWVCIIADAVTVSSFTFYPARMGK